MSSAKKKIAAFLLLFTFIILPAVGMTMANKASALGDDATNGQLWNVQVGIKTIGSDAYGEAGDPQDIRYTIIKMVNLALAFLSVVFFVFIVLAGYRWMTAGGNEEQVSKAKKNITNAVIGLVIAFASWSLSYFILRRMIAIITNEVNYLNPDY